jgi:Putative auto-transporter adhesin, head GIN domain
MKKTAIMLTAAAALFHFSSCEKITGEGPVQSEVRAITGFSGVSAGISGKVNYKIEPAYRVEVIAQRNVLDVIQTTVVGGHLLVKVKDGVKIKSNESIVVNIEAPSANYLRLSGSGDMEVAGPLQEAGLAVSISGSGSITIAQAAVGNRLNADISGSGNMRILSGTAAEEEIRISGSGKYSADGLAADKVKAVVSGSGDVQVKAVQTLEATISGSGTVYYRGNPLITTQISGSGRVVAL